MQKLHIGKVMVHMGVGESGEKLVKAEDVMKQITTQTPIRAIARTTQPAFSVRKGAPIGCKVTLPGHRGVVHRDSPFGHRPEAVPDAVRQTGEFLLRIEEHTDFPAWL